MHVLFLAAVALAGHSHHDDDDDELAHPPHFHQESAGIGWLWVWIVLVVVLVLVCLSTGWYYAGGRRHTHREGTKQVLDKDGKPVTVSYKEDENVYDESSAPYSQQQRRLTAGRVTFDI